MADDGDLMVTPKFIDALELDTIDKLMKLLDDVSKDGKIKKMAMKHFENEKEYEKYMEKFIVLIKEFFYSSKKKAPQQILSIRSKILKMMRKADGKVARNILSHVMTLLVPHLTPKELNAMSNLLIDEKDEDFKIIPLSLTHFTSSRGTLIHEVGQMIENFIKNVSRKNQIGTTRQMIRHLHNQASKKRGNIYYDYHLHYECK